MSLRLACLGPPGTFTEEAAIQYRHDADVMLFPSIPAIASAVASGMADEGVVPIENSLEGSVNDTLDLLIHSSTLVIRQEAVLPVEHCLLGMPGTRPEEVSVIYSHPQALGQCRGFLERCFPRAEALAALSTAAAVEQMRASSTPSAAIGTRRAADLYEVRVIATGIQDSASNMTRFVVLATEDHPPTRDDKTSLCFAFDHDRPGLLYGVLKEFADRNINLAKVESRPTKQSLGNYIFLVDLEGHRHEEPVAQALEHLRQQASFCRVFGSYPRCRTPGA